MMEMTCRPLNMESFGQKMLVLSKQFLQQEGESCILTCEIFYSKSYNQASQFMESFGHKMFISSQPVPLTGTGGLYPRVRDFFLTS